MPFPQTQEALFAAGYEYLRWEDCSECGLCVEVWQSPGKREMVMDPMPSHESPATRHYETCQPKEKNGKDTAGRDSDRSAQVSPDHAGGEVREPNNDSGVQRGIPVGGHDVESIPLFGVTDPNHNLIAAGWMGGTLRVKFSKGEGYHTGVPEDLFTKLRNSRFALRQYNLTIKQKYPYMKVE